MATIAYKEPWTIRAYVAEEALRSGTDYLEWFFQDLFKGGCISWMVGSLIYYSDTHRFFDTHYYEIMDIVEDLEKEWFRLECKGDDLKNKLAWLSFEKVASDMMYNDSGLDF